MKCRPKVYRGPGGAIRSSSDQTRHFLVGHLGPVKIFEKNLSFDQVETARREEKSLVFGDEVPEDKFTSCKPRGNDPRSLIIQVQCHYT